ncbi:hypothetical protein Hanom_Chr14g01327051 [Helianthus anomalus]
MDLFSVIIINFLGLTYSYLSKLQKLSFMFTLYCKLCPLSSKYTRNILNVCKSLHVISLCPNSVSFHC